MKARHVKARAAARIRHRSLWAHFPLPGYLRDTQYRKFRRALIKQELRRRQGAWLGHKPTFRTVT